MKPKKIILLWAACFIYALVLSIVFQKLVMPKLSSLHAGFGLMKDDAFYFHGVAAQISERVKTIGWSEWSLIPGGALTANVGMLSGVYALFGVNPLYFLPVNAAFHALGATLILIISIKLVPSRIGYVAGLITGFLFLTFPSALVWYGQNHKDAFSIVGFLLAILGMLFATEEKTIKSLFAAVLLFLVGMILSAIMRPHQVMVNVLAYTVALTAAVMYEFYLDRKNILTVFSRACVLFFVAVIVMAMAPKSNELIDHLNARSEVKEFYEGAYVDKVTGKIKKPPVGIVVDLDWKKSEYFPEKIDKLALKLSTIRAHFLEYGGGIEAGSIIDAEIKPASVSEMFAYFPRALMVGVLSPFPSFWMQKLTLPRIIGSVETFIFYISLPGMYFFLRRKISKTFLICIISASVIILINSYVTPNIGTLHRSRYGQWFILMLFGVAGWLIFFREYFDSFKDKINTPGSKEINIADSNVVKTTAAGAIVLLVSMLGYFGFLVRDLLLVDRFGLGQELDAYYVAILIPMFISSIVSAPLADAVTSRLSSMNNSAEINKLLKSLTSMTLAGYVLLSLVLILFSNGLLSFFSSGDVLNAAITVFPLALLLMIFSGVVVVANSLINQKGGAVKSAVLQLIVPFVAIAMILISDREHVLVNAILGMVVGQVLNLLAVKFILLRAGYKIMPGKTDGLNAEKLFLRNWGWLSIVAVLTNASTPINYWFASNVGVGAVSTWAIASKLVLVATFLGTSLLTAVFVPYFGKLFIEESGSKVRDSLFISIIAGSWISGAFVMIVFLFVSPLIEAITGNGVDPSLTFEMKSLIQIGALQLPFTFASILVYKYCAVSASSVKAVYSAAAGVILNLIFNFIFVPHLGLIGLSLSWFLSAAFVAFIILIVMSKETSFERRHMELICFTWASVVLMSTLIYYEYYYILFGVLILSFLYMRSRIYSLGMVFDVKSRA